MRWEKNGGAEGQDSLKWWHKVCASQLNIQRASCKKHETVWYFYPHQNEDSSDPKMLKLPHGQAQGRQPEQLPCCRPEKAMIQGINTRYTADFMWPEPQIWKLTVILFFLLCLPPVFSSLFVYFSSTYFWASYLKCTPYLQSVLRILASV